MSDKIKIEWVKCHHGVEKRLGCRQCEEEKTQSKNYLNQIIKHKSEPPKKIPITRGCHAAANGGCFCSGACKEIIGYRDPLFPGENY